MIEDSKYSRIDYKREKFEYEDFYKYTEKIKKDYYIVTNKIPQTIGDLIEGKTKSLLLVGNNVVDLISKNDYKEKFKRAWDTINLWSRYDKVEAFLKHVS